MFFVMTPDAERVRAELDRIAHSPTESNFNYHCVGCTAGGAESAPPGYVVDHFGGAIGHGEDEFLRAKQALESLSNYPASFTRVYRAADSGDSEAPLAPGVIFGTLATHFGFASLHPCRIVDVLSEDGPSERRFGFVLGTLSGHIMRGEERFTVSLDPTDETVRYDGVAVSCPDGLVAAMARPILRRFQRRFQQESIALMAQYCAGRDPSPSG